MNQRISNPDDMKDNCFNFFKAMKKWPIKCENKNLKFKYKIIFILKILI
jgi:hypothetical protein